MKYIILIVLAFLISCSDKLEEKDYPKGFMGTWVGKYVGNEVTIKVQSKKTLQIQYIESGVAFNTNYHFDTNFLVIESPEVWYKIDYIKSNEFKFLKEGDKTINPALNITGIVFTRVE